MDKLFSKAVTKSQTLAENFLCTVLHSQHCWSRVQHKRISGKYTEIILYASCFNLRGHFVVFENSGTRPLSEDNFGYERATEVG